MLNGYAARFFQRVSNMPNNPVSMRKLKGILRLKYGSQLLRRAIAKRLSISPSVVSCYVNRVAQMGS